VPLRAQSQGVDALKSTKYEDNDGTEMAQLSWPRSMLVAASMGAMAGWLEIGPPLKVVFVICTTAALVEILLLHQNR